MPDDVTLKIGGDSKEAQAALAALQGSLGQMVQAAGQLGGAFQETSKSGGVLESGLARLTAAFSVASLVNKAIDTVIGFGQAAWGAGEQLVDMSAKTGLSIEMLQRMQYVGVQTETSLESLANVAFMLGAKLAGGGTSVEGAVRKLGLSYEALLAMSPDQQFETVVTAMGHVTDAGERNRIGIDLMGRAYRTSAAAIDEWAEKNKGAVIASDAEVEALKRQKTAWEALVQNITSATTAQLGNMALAIESHKGLTAAQWATYAVITATEGGVAAENYALGILATQMKTVSYVPEMLRAPIEQLTLAQRLHTTVTDALAGSYAKLDPTIKAAADEFLKGGGAADKLFDTLKEGNPEVVKYEGTLKAYAEAYKKSTEEAKKHTDALKEIASASRPVSDEIAKQVLALEAEKVSEESIAKALGLTITQVREVTEADKKRTQLEKDDAEERLKAHEAEYRKELDLTNAFLAQYESLRDQANELDRQRTLSSYDFQRSQIAKWVADQKTAWGMKEGWEAMYAAIDAVAQRNVDALLIDNKALVDNSKKSLQDIADKDLNTWAEMQAHPEKFSQVAIDAQWAIYQQAQRVADGISVTYGDVLESLSAMFVKMGQVAGGSLGTMLTAMGGITVALAAANKQAEAGKGQFGALSTVFDTHASTTARMAGAAASAATIYAGANAVWDATASHATAAGCALGGMAAGAQAGAAFGPWGMAIGAAAGLVVGIIRGKPAWAKAADDVARDFGVKISDELAKTIAKQAKELFKGDISTSAMFSFSKILSEAGGVTAANLDLMTGKLHDIFSFIERHQLTVAQGAQVLDETFGQFVTAGTNSLGLLDKKLVEIIKLNEIFGTQSKAIADYIAGQLTNAQTGFAAALGVTAAAYAKLAELEKTAATQTGDDLIATNLAMLEQQHIIDATGLHSQAAASATAAALIGIINGQMAAGASFINAVRGMGPSIEALQVQLAATGFTGGAAFDFIRGMVTLANDTIAGPALTSVEGYTAGLVGLSNAGILDQDTFAGLAGQIGATEAALVAQGFSGSQVMLAMRGDLQTIWELQQQYGYTVDASTQALIDQGVAAGLVGAQHMSAADRTAAAMQHVADTLDRIAKGMGFAGDQAGKMADDITDAIDRVPRDVDVHFHGDWTPPGTVPEPAPGPGAQHGIYATSPTRVLFGEGGEPELGGPVSFMAKALRAAMDIDATNRAIAGSSVLLGASSEARAAAAAGSSAAATPTEAQADQRAIAARLEAIHSELAGQPRAIARAVRDALQLAFTG